MENESIVSIFELAEKAFRDGDFEKAKKWYELADQQSRRLGVYQVRLKCMNKLGWLHTIYGDEQQALDCLRTAQKLGSVVFGANHPLYGATLSELAQLYIVQKNFDQAEQFFIAALAIFDGKDYKEIAKIYSGLATIQAFKGDVPSCKYYLAGALSAINDLDLMPIERATVYANVGYALARLDEYDAAAQMLKLAVAEIDQHFGAQHVLNRYNLSVLAWVLQQQEKFYDAEICLQRAISISEAAFGEFSSRLLDDIMSLIEIRCAQGPIEHADPLVRRAIAIADKASESTEKLKLRASVLQTKALLFSSSGDSRRAEAMYRNAMLLHELFFESMDDTTFVIIDRLAELVANDGRHSEAEALYRKLIFLWQHSQGKEYPGITFNFTRLAECLAAQGKFEEATAYYNRAIEICHRTYGSEHFNTALCLESYAKMLKKIGDKQKFHQVEALAQTTWCKIGRYFSFEIDGSVPS